MYAAFVSCWLLVFEESSETLISHTFGLWSSHLIARKTRNFAIILEVKGFCIPMAIIGLTRIIKWKVTYRRFATLACNCTMLIMMNISRVYRVEYFCAEAGVRQAPRRIYDVTARLRRRRRISRRLQFMSITLHIEI